MSGCKLYNNIVMPDLCFGSGVTSIHGTGLAENIRE